MFNKVILKQMIYSQENRCFDHFQNFSQETTEGKEEEASIQNCLWEPVIQVMWSRNSNTMCLNFCVCVSSNMIHWIVNSGRKMLVAETSAPLVQWILQGIKETWGQSWGLDCTWESHSLNIKGSPQVSSKPLGPPELPGVLSAAPALGTLIWACLTNT